ncbi:MAG: CPBP family intramembrane metalloprotease [Gemmatimonadaceae bacterium]|nr:CPBP family intramembrane metalloprotease [Gemmatimonadaceae bacterium]
MKHVLVALLAAIACTPALSVAQAVRPPLLSARGRADEPDRSRLRLPMLLVGTGVEAAAISTGQLIPYLGAGHAAAGRWGHAASYAAGEVGLIALRRSLIKRVGASDVRRYPNVDSDTLSVRSGGVSPSRYAVFRLADHAYHTAYYLRMIDLGSAYQYAQARSRLSTTIMDQSSPARLALAPVHPRDLSSAWVAVPIALAGASGLMAPRSRRPLSQVSEMTVLGTRMSKVPGTLLALGYEATYLLSTAIGEELFFRGVMQTEMEDRYGRSKGVAVSTAAFSAFHVPNHGVKGALISGVAGAYLGYRYSKNGYNLREVIATHFWIDFLPGVVQIMRDPRSGRSVSEVRWPSRD